MVINVESRMLLLFSIVDICIFCGLFPYIIILLYLLDHTLNCVHASLKLKNSQIKEMTHGKELIFIQEHPRWGPRNTNQKKNWVFGWVFFVCLFFFLQKRLYRKITKALYIHWKKLKNYTNLRWKWKASMGKIKGQVIQLKGSQQKSSRGQT